MDLLTPQCASQSVGPANQLFGLLIQTILAAQCTISPPEMWPKDYGPTAIEKGLDEYDFIVIGAGSAGSVVASRLSEIENWKVLLLEAGGDPPIESEIPNLSFTLQNTKYDWNYTIENGNKQYKGLKNVSKWPQGKMLGGSSAIDFSLFHLRGYPQEYNEEWQMMADHWKWENIYKKFESSLHDNLDNQQTRPHISLNKMQLNDGMEFIKNIFINAALNEIGLKEFYNNDTNHIGFTQNIFKHLDEKNKRCNAAKAYLNKVSEKRPNLTIIKNAHVLKINFNKTQSINNQSMIEANGINFKIDNNEQIFTVNIRKEIISSAGAIGTPNLLHLSGIGPEKYLNRLNIPLVKNLQVGKNLQQHILVPLIFKFKNGSNTNSRSFDFTTFSTQFGPIDFITNLNVNSLNNNTPDIQNMYIYFNRMEQLLEPFLRSFGYTDDNLIKTILAENVDNDVIFIMMHLLKPKSLGKLFLKNSDNKQQQTTMDTTDMKIIIQPNGLDRKEDVQTLIDAILYNRKFLQTKIFKENAIEEVQLNLNDCQEYETMNIGSKSNCEQYLKCYVRSMGTGFNQFCGTAKMGSINDYYSVVDWNLKVHGINRLRIADASIIPKIPSGNLNVVSNMIGEQVIDFILNDWPPEGIDEKNTTQHEEL